MFRMFSREELLRSSCSLEERKSLIPLIDFLCTLADHYRRDKDKFYAILSEVQSEDEPVMARGIKVFCSADSFSDVAYQFDPAHTDATGCELLYHMIIFRAFYCFNHLDSKHFTRNVLLSLLQGEDDHIPLF